MQYDMQDDPAPRDKQQLMLRPFPGAVVMHDVDDSGSSTIFDSLVFRALLIALPVATLVSWVG